MIKTKDEAIYDIIESCEKVSNAQHAERDMYTCLNNISYLFKREKHDKLLKNVNRMQIHYVRVVPKFTVF